MATRRRVNPELMRAFESSQVEPFDLETPGRVIDVPVPPEHFGMAPEQPPVFEPSPRSRFDVVRDYLEQSRQPMPMPTTPEVDVRGAADFDARRNFGQSMLAAGQAFTGNRRAMPQVTNAAETQAMGERDARRRELEQWAASKERQRMGEAALLSSAAIEPREASKPAKTPEQVDRELAAKEFANETGRIKAEKVKPPKAPKDPDSSKLRKEFDSLPEVRDFKDVDVAYKKIQGAAKNVSAAGDLSLIFAYMKMLDPGSTVREGEFANAQNAGGVDDKAKAAYNNVLNGQRLTESQRADFLGQAKGLYEAQRQQYSAAAQRYRGLAEKQKMAPDDVAMDRAGDDQPEPMVNVKRKSDGKVLPLPKSKASTLDKAKYEVMP